MVRRRTRSVVDITPDFSDQMLYGTGWRARWRKRRGKTLPIYLSINHGTDSAESVVVVGQKNGKLIVERAKW
jgi:hypothetical protein